jgi:RNA polymerase sigma-70 factor (ECF subfamily)
LSTASITPVPDSLHDDGIVARIIAGDRNALRLLMQRHNQRLFRTARSILRNDAEAEDALQEAWLHAWRAMSGFQHNSRLSTWLVRIVINEALGRLRKSSRRAQVISLDGQNVDDTREAEADTENTVPEQPELTVYRGEMRRLVEQRIDALPDAFRTVFVLRAIEEMTVAETSECLDLPEATVRTRFFRARRLLREALAVEIDLATDEAFGFDGERCERITRQVLARIESR